MYFPQKNGSSPSSHPLPGGWTGSLSSSQPASKWMNCPTREQSLEVADITVPPAEYSDLRAFLNAVSGYQHTILVLTAK